MTKGEMRSVDFNEYPTMTISDICALPVRELAAVDAHLYLWTTQTFLRDTYSVLDAWGFRQGAILVWSKPPKGVCGTYVASTEFCLFARRGSLQHKRRQLGTCYQWPRSAHSAKPEAFIDMVESVSPGPYLEMFARRNRLGWSTWGNQCLEHVSLHTGAVAPSSPPLRNELPEDDASPQVNNRGGSPGFKRESVRSTDWLEGAATSPTVSGGATPDDCRNTEPLKAAPSNEPK